MSPMRLIILLVAAGAAIAAVFLVRAAGAPAPAAAATAEVVRPKELPSKQILVAKAAIPVGKAVTIDDLKWQAWPENAPTGAFIDEKKEPEALKKMVGAIARFDLVEGEPITATKLVHAGNASFMAAMLTPGTRAASIEISPETAAGGFIQPNDRVDVVVIRELEDDQASGGMPKVRSDLILANIRVLAIDGIYAPPKPEGEDAAAGQGAALIGTRATLELAEKDVVVINAAKKAGDLALSLRSIADMQGPSGATGYGRVYRDGVSQGSEGIRVYRNGAESVATTPAG
jgi:pilus assembly protein CpaB